MKPLTQDKKLDFSGVLITFIGLLAFLALVSPAKSSFTGGLSEFFYQIAGIGAFLIPVAFFVVGMWVLFRSWERLPHFSAARLVGIGLLMLNAFTLIYFIAGAAFSGALGAMFGMVIMDGLGPLGAIAVWIAWLLVALALTLDLSLPDLIRAFAHAGEDFVAWWQARRAPRSDRMRNAQPSRASSTPPAAAPFTELTDDFTPLSPSYQTRIACACQGFRFARSKTYNETFRPFSHRQCRSSRRDPLGAAGGGKYPRPGLANLHPRRGG